MLRFSRPKGPGFGISSEFYLSVLSSHATLPGLTEVINPSGEGGAVAGFGVPLAPDATKESLSKPMSRGTYALASKDRKTVIKMIVVSKDEVGFDPEAVARHSETLGVEGELLNRIRGSWTILQLRFESHDPAVYPALNILLGLAGRIAMLTEGAVADPICQRYLLPDQVFARPRINPLVDAREHVSIQLRATPAGVLGYTLGLQKFALHELEIQALDPGSEADASSFLLQVCQSVLEGNLLRSGQRVARFEVREGGFDRALWEGIPCFELLPPTSMTATEALRAN